jgi:pyrrolidone-carboxylate peptidase
MVVQSEYDIENIIKKLLKKGIDYTVNEKPSNHLCNYAYYRLLCIMKGNAILIHIPFSIEFLLS